MIASGFGRATATLWTLLAVALLAGLASCDKAPLTAPTGATITIFANATTVPLNGSADITASVLEKPGTAVHDGTTVTFTSTLGRLDPPEAQTRNGKATVKFLAGSISGTAKIRAFSGAAGTESPVAEVELKVGGAAAGRLTLNASPATVPSLGGTVQLVATVSDTDGNLLVGVPVSFTTSAGTLGAGLVSTNSNGEAQTTLRTDREATVTASAGGSQSAQVTVRVTQAPTISITVVTANPTAGQPTTFTVAVAPGANSGQISDVRVNFGDGSSTSLGRVSGSQNVQHVYQEAGNFTVTATVEDTSGESNSVSTVVVVTPLIVSVSLSTSPLFPAVNTPVTVTVSVTPTTIQVENYRFDWGDTDNPTIDDQTSNVATHVYVSPGVKTVRVTVFLPQGLGQFVATTSISVQLTATTSGVGRQP